MNKFEKDLGCALDASFPTSSSSDRWNNLCDAVYNKAVKTFGFSNKRIPGWFKVLIDTIDPALDQKRITRLAYFNKPCMENLDRLKMKCVSRDYSGKMYATKYKTALIKVRKLVYKLL